MSLPIVPLDVDTITIGGTSVQYRSLSREQVTRLASFGSDTDAAESYMISCSTGVTIDEAAEWRKQVSAPTVNELLTAISIISGLRSAKGSSGNR